jgi:glycosyltransferase involved in cell wall biosynthesis
MQKIVIIASLEKNFATSGVGKYILSYIDLFQQKYEVSFLFQPENHWMIKWFLRRIFILPQLLKKEYKDHIKVFYDENFLVAWRDRMKSSAIFIIHHYPLLIKTSTYIERIMKPIHYFWFNYILKRIAYVVTASKFTYNILAHRQNISEKHLYCIENCIDEHIYIPSKQKEQTDTLTKKYWLPGWTMLLCVAVAEYRKNIPTLIKLLHRLPEQYFLVRIWKHLPGKEDMLITYLLKKYNLKERYVYLTQVSENDLVHFYQSAHLFLFPSLFEWFGRPPLEAQACWCPVISTHEGALWEVLWTSAYIIQDVLDEMAWKYAVEEMCGGQKREQVITQWLHNAQRFSKKFLDKKRKRLLEKVSSLK